MINCFKYIIKIPNILKKLAVLTSNLALFFKKSFNLNIYHFNTRIDLGPGGGRVVHFVRPISSPHIYLFAHQLLM